LNVPRIAEAAQMIKKVARLRRLDGWLVIVCAVSTVGW
jgi:hypothetical protein